MAIEYPTINADRDFSKKSCKKLDIETWLNDHPKNNIQNNKELVFLNNYIWNTIAPNR